MIMESVSDKRFDPLLATQLLLDVAQERSVEPILKKLVDFSVERAGFSFSTVWLVQKGDLCATCMYRSECADQSRCLHLIAGKGRSLPGCGKGTQPYEDLDARVPLNLGPLGEAVATGQLKVIKNPGNQPISVPGFEWLREERISEYGIRPIVFKGEVLGAIVSFSPEDMPETIAPWSRIFADHIGAAIANARAFDEIQHLKGQLELQNTYLQEAVVEAKAFGDLVGQSAALRHVVGQIDVVAPTEASVLILGETGTGKELVAHEIHRRSARRDGPLVRVNCASIPRELFESEFFGHVRGSFTGAVKDRAGRFETAEGGTIFLDEVGEIPLDIQNKLLRVLQEKRYERVGDDRTRRANVRIVAATNRDLKKAAAAGKFREDLYYRLNVFPIQVPPLRERLDDIPSLAQHFVELSARELKCAKPRLTRAAVTQLHSYDWPGNVRELRNVVERAVILARGKALEFDLPMSCQAAPAPRSIPKSDSSAVSPAQPKFLTEAEVERFERDNLLHALEAANWKISGPDSAAELLGVKPTTLLSRMTKWGLKRPEHGTS
ncbi:MAG TPA: sigma 54-interacting transcriptional regulator [Candidatus Limnocylindrales bacterium]|jgi:transcriptional regulator with GAF, ATPase, and Fis domain|nr:sigma 54-interacting transcriptional regulator [Candidatus Limnocylindrales bacterium]